MTRWEHVCNSAFHRGRMLALVVAALVSSVSAFILPPSSLAAGPPVDPPPQAFVVGWWQVDVREHADEYVKLGVNTAFGTVDYGKTMSKAAYEDALTARGLGFVNEPDLTRLSVEARQPLRRGWAQRDEVDLSSHQGTPGYTLADFAAVYKACKAANPQLPVWINFAGLGGMDNLYYDGRRVRTDVTPNVARPFWHAAADGGWMAFGDVEGFDAHLWTTGRAGMFNITRRLLSRCSDWSGGKDVFLYVETCPQGKPVAFTADDYETQVWQAVVYCAQHGIKLRGIIYFSHTFSAAGAWNGFDGTSAEVKARMADVHRRLAAFAAGQVVPLSAGAVVSAPGPPATQPAAGPVEARVAELERRVAAIAAAAATTQPSR